MAKKEKTRVQTEFITSPKVRPVCLLAQFDAPESLSYERITNILQRALDNAIEEAQDEENDQDPDCTDLELLPTIKLTAGPVPEVYIQVEGGVVNAVGSNRACMTAEVFDYDDDNNGGPAEARARLRWLEHNKAAITWIC